MSINETISAYIEAKEAEAKAKKTVDAMKALIMQYAGNNDVFETTDYIVSIKTTISSRLDTKALYKDFPDVKDVYNRPTESKTIIPTAKPETMQKTA